MAARSFPSYHQGALPRDSTGGLNRELHQGARSVTSTGGHELDWFTRGADAAISFLPHRLHRWGLWCGGCGEIHYPPATDLAGGRSPFVEGDHWSGVAGKQLSRKHTDAPRHTHWSSSVLIWIVGEGVSECWCRAGDGLRGRFGSRLSPCFLCPPPPPAPS